MLPDARQFAKRSPGQTCVSLRPDARAAELPDASSHAPSLYSPADRGDQRDPRPSCRIRDRRAGWRTGARAVARIVADPNDKRLTEVARVCIAVLAVDRSDRRLATIASAPQLNLLALFRPHPHAWRVAVGEIKPFGLEYGSTGSHRLIVCGWLDAQDRVPSSRAACGQPLRPRVVPVRKAAIRSDLCIPCLSARLQSVLARQTIIERPIHDKNSGYPGNNETREKHPQYHDEPNVRRCATLDI